MEKLNDKPVLIIGGGYSGLAAAYELVNNGQKVILIEKESELGGLSRTFSVDDVKFDMGPHIYFNQDKDVTQFWKKLVGEKMRPHLRNNKIYYQGKFIQSPLSLIDTYVKIGPFAIARILLDYLLNRFKKHEINNAEDWVIANFGKELYKRFFKVYNQKIWGLPSDKVTANWAGQRIKTSLFSMIYRSLVKDKEFIIKTFDFPDGGSATIIDALRNHLIDTGKCAILLNNTVKKIHFNDHVVVSVETADNNIHEVGAVISTVTYQSLSEMMPEESKQKLKPHVDKLLYRHLVLVNLVFDRDAVKNFSEHWIDVHDPAVIALRVTNFSNYNFGMSDDKNAGVGVEYNCFATDKIWTDGDDEILQTTLKDLKYMNLIKLHPIAYRVVRIPFAYPVYFAGYEQVVEAIDKELSQIPNLYSIGRNGMYKWNNMHHSVKTGIYAAQNIMGAKHNIRNVRGMVSIGKEYALNE